MKSRKAQTTGIFVHDILVEVLQAIFSETVTDSGKTFIYLWSVALFRTTDRVLLLV